MALRKLTLTRGDTQTYTLRFMKGTSGTPYDLTGWTVYLTLKTDWNQADSAAAAQKIVTSHGTAGTNGYATISLASTDTVNLDPGEYFFDIAVKTVANETYTVMKGLFNLEYDVTRTP
jgi:hypothetical protein